MFGYNSFRPVTFQRGSPSLWPLSCQQTCACFAEHLRETAGHPTRLPLRGSCYEFEQGRLRPPTVSWKYRFRGPQKTISGPARAACCWFRTTLTRSPCACWLRELAERTLDLMYGTMTTPAVCCCRRFFREATTKLVHGRQYSAALHNDLAKARGYRGLLVV